MGGSNYLFPVRRIPAFFNIPHRIFVVVLTFPEPLIAKINNLTHHLPSPFFLDIYEQKQEFYTVMIRVFGDPEQSLCGRGSGG
jgi:hypothetical protein